MKILNLSLLILLTCWCGWAIYSLGDMRPSDNLFMWLLSVISLCVCLVGWVYSLTK